MKKSLLLVLSSILFVSAFSLVACDFGGGNGASQVSTIALEEAPEFISRSLIDFHSDATAIFEASDQLTNGDPFGVTWNKDNAVFDAEEGTLTLSLTKDEASGVYYGGEVKTYGDAGAVQYGYFGCTMKPSNVVGTASTFFTYTGDYEGNAHNEIDIEFLGKDTTKVQFNYFAYDEGGHEYWYDLGFDASEEFHKYGFFWNEAMIVWFVDDVPVYGVYASLESAPQRVYANYWSGEPTNEGIMGWMGKVDDNDLPATTVYKDITVVYLNGTTPVIPEKEYVPTAEEFTSTSFAMSGGSKVNGEYVFNYVNNQDGTVEVTYTNALPKSYKNVYGNVSDAVASSEYVRMKIKNDSAEDYVKVRIDVQAENNNAAGIKAINEKAWMNGKQVRTDLKYGGSFFDIPAGEEAECIIKFHGIPVSLLFMFDTCGREDKESFAGSLTISDFGYTGENSYVEQHVSLNASDIRLRTDETFTLIATATAEVIWSVDNPNVLSVENGLITPIAEGTAIVTARCGDAVAVCSVTVSNVSPKAEETFDICADEEDVFAEGNHANGNADYSLDAENGYGTSLSAYSWTGRSSGDNNIFYVNAAHKTMKVTAEGYVELFIKDVAHASTTARESGIFLNLFKDKKTKISDLSDYELKLYKNYNDPQDAGNGWSYYRIPLTLLGPENAEFTMIRFKANVNFSVGEVMYIDGVKVVGETVEGGDEPEQPEQPVVVDHSAETLSICADEDELWQGAHYHWINGTHEFITDNYYGNGTASASALKWTGNATGENMAFYINEDKSETTIAENAYVEFFIKSVGHVHSTRTRNGVYVMIAYVNDSGKTASKGTKIYADQEENAAYRTDAGNDWYRYVLPMTLFSTVGDNFDQIRISVAHDMSEGEAFYIDGLRYYTEGQVVPADGVTLNKSAISLTEGASETLIATASGEVIWTSSDEAIATVEGGVVTAVAAGTATITATCGTASATCTVTVTAQQSEQPVEVDHSAETLEICADDEELWRGERLHWINGTHEFDTENYYGNGTNSKDALDIAGNDKGTNMAFYINLDHSALAVSENQYVELFIKNAGHVSDSGKVNGVYLHLCLKDDQGATHSLGTAFNAYKNYNLEYKTDAGNGWYRFVFPVTAMASVGSTFDQLRLTIPYTTDEGEILFIDGLRFYTEGSVTPQPVDSVTLDKSALELTEGDNSTLIATASGEVVWTSSDEAVATVEGGVVTAVAAGTAFVTATCGTASATCTVTVTAQQSEQPVAVDHSAETLEICAESEDLLHHSRWIEGTSASDEENYYGQGASTASLRWTECASSNNMMLYATTTHETLTVSDTLYLELFIKTVGHDDNVAMANGVYATLYDTVNNSSVKVNNDAFKLYKTYNNNYAVNAGNGWWYYKFPVNVIVANGSTFTQLRLSVAYAMNEGEVMFIDGVRFFNEGSAAPADSVSLDKSALELAEGGNATLIATASGEVVWTSSDEAVATVEGGVVTAVAAGTAFVTATCGTASATCTVTVTAQQGEQPVDPHAAETLEICAAEEDLADIASISGNGTKAHEYVNTYGNSVKAVAWSGTVQAYNYICFRVETTYAVTTDGYIEFFFKDVNFVASSDLSVNGGLLQLMGATDNDKLGTEIKNYKNYNTNCSVDAGNGWTRWRFPLSMFGLDVGTEFNAIRFKLYNTLAEDEIIYFDGIRIVAGDPAAMPDYVTLNKSDTALYVGANETLTATSNGEVTWTTSDSAVATVSGGVITAVAAGTATITATYGTASATCTVTVSEPPAAIDHSEETMTIGEDGEDLFRDVNTVAYWINGTYEYDTNNYYGQGASSVALAWKPTDNMMLPVKTDRSLTLTINENLYIEFFIKDTGRSNNDSVARANGVYMRFYNGSSSVKVDGYVDVKAYKNYNTSYLRDAGNGWTYYKFPTTMFGTDGATFDRVRLSVAYAIEENETIYFDGIRFVYEEPVQVDHTAETQTIVSETDDCFKTANTYISSGNGDLKSDSVNYYGATASGTSLSWSGVGQYKNFFVHVLPDKSATTVSDDKYLVFYVKNVGHTSAEGALASGITVRIYNGDNATKLDGYKDCTISGPNHLESVTDAGNGWYKVRIRLDSLGAVGTTFDRIRIMALSAYDSEEVTYFDGLTIE